MTNLHADVFFGQQRLNHFRPLDKTKISTVKIVLKTDVVGFFQLFNALEIKVIDRFSFLGDILIHNSKSRAIHLIGDTHSMAEVLD